MMFRNYRIPPRVLTVAVSLLLSGQVIAQTPGEWGASANGAHGGCTDDTCIAPLAFIVEEGNGGLNVPNADYSITNSSGSASSSVTFVGALSVPNQTASALSNSNAFQQGTATAVQGYTYDGLAPGTISLSTTLTGINNNPDADAMTGLSARVSLVPVSSGFLFTQASIVSLLYATAPFVEYEVTANGAVNQSQMVAIDLLPGEQFYVVSLLSATAAGAGASADSSNTLTMQFVIDDAQNDPDPFSTLTPSVESVEGLNVPIAPPLAGLFAALLILAIGVTQKRNKQA